MAEWNAEEFYEKNKDSEASFLIGTAPLRTDLDSYLSLVLKQILEKKLSGHIFLGTVHTMDGPVKLSTEQYRDLLSIQEARESQEPLPE